MTAFWPPVDPAQVDYEHLRAAALACLLPATATAAAFARTGLAGLLARPAVEASFVARLHPGRRPRWEPYADPRLDLLADAFELVLGAGPDRAAQEQAR